MRGGPTAAAMLAAALAAGCASPAAPAGPAAYVPPPPTHIDGRYRGIARLARADGRGCPRSGIRIVTVEGNALVVPYRGRAASYSLAATVGPDGSIHGSDGRGTVDGQISGTHMDLTVSSDFCDLRYALERS